MQETIVRACNNLKQYLETGNPVTDPLDSLEEFRILIEDLEKKEKQRKNNLAELALNYWRLSNWVGIVNVDRKMQANSALRKMGAYLEKEGIELRDLIGQKYDDGYAADVMGIESEQDVPDENLIVIETVKPIILLNGSVIKYGQVVLGDKVKELTTIEGLPLDPEQAIPILQKNIDQYCASKYKDKRIANKLRWCRIKLDKWLRKRGVRR